MRRIIDSEVLANDCVAPDHCRMRLTAPDIAREARPGQFGMLQVAQGLSPFLRRPMCFEQIEGDTLAVLYKIEGEGTRMLSTFRPGQRLSLQGPLGNGWPIETGFSRHVIVSGGIGVAPFPALARALKDATGKPPEVILAARTKDYVVGRELFEGLGCPLRLATDDGSLGEKAFASTVLADLEPGPGTRVYACGPMAMMHATGRVCEHAGANCLVSLEAQMACGDGACLGCVVEAKTEREGEPMVRVCVDGPIFDARLIDWETHNLAYDP